MKSSSSVGILTKWQFVRKSPSIGAFDVKVTQINGTYLFFILPQFNQNKLCISTNAAFT